MGLRFAALLVAIAAMAQTPGHRPATFDTRPALALSNGALELLVLPRGAAFVSLTLAGDPEKLNPLWDPARMRRELGEQATTGDGTGHFICVDGFGPVSPEEQAAGLRGHGEAHRLDFEIKSSATENRVSRLVLETTLPLLQERFTRTVRMVEGENVVRVDSELENLLAFDRPVVWAEHATIGSPFLDPGVTVVDMPAERSRTRPYEARPGRLPHRLASDREFTWPNAPTAAGGTVDVRAAPSNPNSGDHTTCLMDRRRKVAWVTALHPERRLILGYIFRHSDFPWVQSWENYPATRRLARGLEFSTQPFDVPRREAISSAAKEPFGAPTYRWLPAKSKIQSRFLIFFARSPEGMKRVDDVRVENGSLIIDGSNLSFRLKAALSDGVVSQE